MRFPPCFALSDSPLTLPTQNRVPSCPLCSQPVTFPVGTDPNPAMDHHLSSACVVLNPHLASSSGKAKPPPGGMPICHQRRCQSKMVVPIKCSDCQEEFCPTHRWGKDHACPGKRVAAPPSKPGAGAKALAAGMGMGAIKSRLASGTAAGEKAGLAALRRAQVAMSLTSASTTSSSKKPPLGSAGNPIVIDDDDDDDEVQIVPGKKKAKLGIAGIPVAKVDRRAMAERASARKALESRMKKGYAL